MMTAIALTPTRSRPPVGSERKWKKPWATDSFILKKNAISPQSAKHPWSYLTNHQQRAPLLSRSQTNRSKQCKTSQCSTLNLSKSSNFHRQRPNNTDLLGMRQSKLVLISDNCRSNTRHSKAESGIQAIHLSDWINVHSCLSFKLQVGAITAGCGEPNLTLT